MVTRAALVEEAARCSGAPGVCGERLRGRVCVEAGVGGGAGMVGVGGSGTVCVGENVCISRL